MRAASPLLLLVLLLAACGPTAAPSPSAAAGSSPGPSVAPLTDADLAFDVASRFERARAGEAWDDAWAILAPSSQTSIGLVEQFVLDETAYNANGGTAFVVTEPSQDPGLTEQLLGSRRQAVGVEADLERGYVVLITHPGVPATSGGTRAYLAAPLIVGGEWRLWPLA